MVKNLKTAMIFHGALGNPQENWFPWLAQKLRDEHFDVYVPAFPVAEKQSLKGWFEALSPYDQYIRANTKLIGHSLGATFVLRVLEKLDFQIDSAFLVAGFAEKLGQRQFDYWNGTFLERPFDWEQIRRNCAKFYVYGSDNDPVVKYPLVKKLADNLGTKIITIPGAGHFNSAAGFTTFERLLIDVKNS